MTRFTVVWRREAEEELAKLWLQATDRAALSSASVAIDRTLANDPAEKGADIGQGLFTLILAPLVVVYSISDDDRMVRVQLVRAVPDVAGT